MIVVVKIVLLLIVAFMFVDLALVVVYHKKKLTKSKTLDSNICEFANGAINCVPKVNHNETNIDVTNS